jgi:hypothetical protein
MSEEKIKNKIKILLELVNKEGYDEGIKKFIKKFSEYKIELLNPQFNQTVDNFVYSYTKNNDNCLVIQNKFGNSMETLSNIYKNVVSQNSIQENLKFQEIRIKKINKNNIKINIYKKNNFPYEDNIFDLIIYEDFFNEIKDLDNKQIIKLISELKRILHKKGSFYFVTKETEIDLEIIFKKVGLKFEKYWSMQKNSIPSFSGKFDDELSLKWCMRNFSSFTNAKKMSMKKKIGLFAMKIASKKAKIFKDKIVPSTIYRCYKEKEPSMIDFVQNETGFEHCIVQSRPKKIIMILLNQKGDAEKILNFQRYGMEFPKKIVSPNRIFPEMGNPNQRLWIEDWFSGRNINLTKSKEVQIVLDWLINFQNETQQENMTKQDIKKEINNLKIQMKNYKIVNFEKYFSWLNDYQKFLNENSIRMTAVHGDLWLNNIIFDEKQSKINVIDWEKYRKRGSALEDFMFFFTNLVTKTQGSPLDFERFKKFLDKDSQENNLIQMIKPKIDECFNTNIDLLLLIKIEIIKRIIAPPFGTAIINQKSKEIQHKMLKFLEEKQSNIF